VLTKVVPELAGLSSIFVLPLVSIVMALVYLKMRQLGGEPINQTNLTIDGQRTGASREQRQRTTVR
jgi:hypothetical protein